MFLFEPRHTPRMKTSGAGNVEVTASRGKHKGVQVSWLSNLGAIRRQRQQPSSLPDLSPGGSYESRSMEIFLYLPPPLRATPVRCFALITFRTSGCNRRKKKKSRSRFPSAKYSSHSYSRASFI